MSLPPERAAVERPAYGVSGVPFRALLLSFLFSSAALSHLDFGECEGDSNFLCSSGLLSLLGQVCEGSVVWARHIPEE